MRIPFLCTLLSVAAHCEAQDLVAMSFQGDVYAIDSHTGEGQLLLASGASSNAMCRKGSTLWIEESTGIGPIRVHHLSQVNEQTGIVTRIFSNVGANITGLAGGGTNGQILGIVSASPSDLFAQISINSGTVTNVGPTGFTQLQALTLTQGTFYAWDLTAGLVTIDHLTGLATDVNPNIGNGGVDIQFLCVMADGRMLGGRNELYEIDKITGVPSLIGGSGFSDLRGGEERFGWVENYGSACNGSRGPTNLTVTGAPNPGHTITAVSIGHGTNVPGILCIGLSRTHAGPTPLPFLVDPLLGTVGCSVLQSSDITVFGLGNILGRLSFNLSLPGNLVGRTFFVQHAALDPVPGGWSFSNAATIRTAL